MKTVSALLIIVANIGCATFGFKIGARHYERQATVLHMSDLVLAATPTVEEWLDLCDPGLKRTTLAMFKACKEIAYKIRTASCNKLACFNQFGNYLQTDA